MVAVIIAGLIGAFVLGFLGGSYITYQDFKSRCSDVEFRRLITREGKGPDRRPRI